MSRSPGSPSWRRPGRRRRLHALIKEAVPGIEVKTWYGMPAYAVGGATICFFQPASRVKARFATLGIEPPTAADTPPQLTSRIDTELRHWTDVIKTSNINVD